jgi:hypothetical protein
MPGLCASDVPIDFLSNARNLNFLEIHRAQCVTDLQPKSQVDGFPHESVDIVVDIGQKDFQPAAAPGRSRPAQPRWPRVATVP